MYRLLFSLLLGFSILGAVGAHAQDSTAFRYFNKAGELLMQAPDSALYYYETAQPLFKAAEQWGEYVDCFNGAANCHYLQGNFEEFEGKIRQALEAAEQYLGKDSEVYSATVNNMGVVLRNKGHYTEALTYLKQSLDIDLKRNTDKLSIADSYQNINAVYRVMGDYDEAINYLKKALRLRQDSLGELSYPVASTHLALAHNYRDKQAAQEGLAHYRKYLGIIQSGKIPAKAISQPEWIYCYQGMAQLYMELENWDSSRYFINQALRLQEAPKASRKIQSYEILGDFHLRQAKGREALEAYQEAAGLALQRSQRFSSQIIKARTLRLVGNAFQQLAEADSALHYYQAAFRALALDFDPAVATALPTIEQLLSKIHALEITGSKARALQLKYQQNQELAILKAAQEHYQYATKIIDQLRHSYLSEGSKHNLAREALKVYEGGIQTALLLHQAEADPQYLETAFAFAERNKSMLLLEALQNSEARIGGQLSTADLEKEQKLSIDINFYEGKIIREKQRGSKANVAKIKGWEDQLFNLRQAYNQLIQHFEQAYPQYYALKYNTQIASVAALRQHFINKQSALIEYFIGKEEAYIFCLTNSDLQVFPIQPSPQLFEQQQQLLELLHAPPFQGDFTKNHQTYGNLLSQLSKQLIQPVLAQLPPAVKRLIIIPEDQLAYLPFELLLLADKDDSKAPYSLENFPYLISRYAISSNYSATLLLNHSRPAAASDLISFTGFGPSFGDPSIASSRDCSSSEIYSLQCNQQEVEAIQKLLGGQVRLGLEANIDAFKALAEQSRILHLATHACAGQEDPALNKVFFTDGYLATPELRGMQLKAELAVLSACNTGSGKLIKGEGVMSLSRSFILAGCPSTLMSLWTVDDCLTSELMLRFYTHLKAGEAKDEALRQAKLDHLKQADQVGRHPYYWAAFVQSGNPEAMTFRSGAFGWARIVLLIAVVLFGYFKLKN